MRKSKVMSFFLAAVMVFSLCGAMTAFAEDGYVQKKIDNNAIRLEMTGTAFTDFEAGGTKTFNFTVPTTGTYGMWLDNATKTASAITAVVKNGETEIFNQTYTTDTGSFTRGHEKFGDEKNLHMALTAGVTYSLTMTSAATFTGMKYVDFRCLALPVLSDVGTKAAVHPADFYTSKNMITQHNHQQYHTGAGLDSSATLVGDYTKPQETLRTPLFTETGLATKHLGIVLNNNTQVTYKVVAAKAGWYDIDVTAAASPTGRALDLRLSVNGARVATRRYTASQGSEVLKFPAVWLNEGENDLLFLELTSALYFQKLMFTSLGTECSDTPTAIAPTGETDVELINAHAVSGVSNYAGGFKAKAGHYSEQDITFSETGYYNFYTYMKAHQASFKVLVGEAQADGTVASYTDVTSEGYTDKTQANLNSAGRGWSSEGYLRLLMYNARLFEAGKTYRVRIEFLTIDPSTYKVNTGFVVDANYEAFVGAPLTVKRTDGVISGTETTYISGWDAIPNSRWGWITWTPVEQAYQGIPSGYDSVFCVDGSSTAEQSQKSSKLRNVLFLKGNNNEYYYNLKVKTAGLYNIALFADSGTATSTTNTFTYAVDSAAEQEKTITDDSTPLTAPFDVTSVYLTEGDHTVMVKPQAASGGTWRMYGLAVSPVNETYIALDEENSLCTYNVQLSEITGEVIVALYSGNELVGVATSPVTEAQTKVSGTVTYTGTKPDYAKVLVWSDLENIVPLLDAVTIENTNWY